MISGGIVFFPAGANFLHIDVYALFSVSPLRSTKISSPSTSIWSEKNSYLKGFSEYIVLPLSDNKNEDADGDDRFVSTEPAFGQLLLKHRVEGAVREGERSGGLLIKEATKKGYKEAQPGDTVDLGYAGSNTRRGRVGRDIAHTLETSCIQGIVENGGRIRRLMPRECLRLQGFEDEQIDRILAINSDAQAYKQAGNSVTVTMIEAIGRRIRAVDEELRKEAAA